MIPTNDKVKLFKRGKKDSWGIHQHSTEPILLQGMVSYNAELVELKNVEGKTVAVTGSVTFIGSIGIVAGDKLGIDVSTNVSTDTNTSYEVLKVQPITDLAGVVLMTKAVF